MHKIFAQVAFMSGLFLMAGIGQANPSSGEAGTHTDSSYLYFKVLATEPTVNLNLIGVPDEIIQVSWKKNLPTFIESEDHANMTGAAGLAVFQFKAHYNLVETASGETFPLTLDMSNVSCELNNGSEPLKFETSGWTYNVSLSAEPNGNANVFCSITVTSTIKEEAGETCTENPNQAECISQCETSNGQESWCATLCTTQPTYAWCVPSEVPVTQAIVTIKNQLQ